MLPFHREAPVEDQTKVSWVFPESTVRQFLTASVKWLLRPFLFATLETNTHTDNVGLMAFIFLDCGKGVP